MRKLLIILTMIVSSFFFYSINVNAAGHDMYVSEDDFELINKDFMTVREYAINYSAENNCHYVIYYENSLYNILFFKFPSNVKNSYSGLIYYQFTIYPGTTNPAIYVQYENGNFNIISSQTSSNTSHRINITSSTVVYSKFLDTNHKGFFCSSQQLNIIYGEKTYTVNSTNSFPSLYEIYVDNFGEYKEEDIHSGEKEVLSNFYTTVIIKISYLAESISSNYIFLSIIGIFILIFVFELIIRRLL